MLEFCQTISPNLDNYDENEGVSHSSSSRDRVTNLTLRCDVVEYRHGPPCSTSLSRGRMAL